MRATLIFQTRRGEHALLRREKVVKTEILRIGRGADCELYLPDPRLLLLHATIHRRPDGFWIEAAGEALIGIGNAQLQTAALKPGTDIRVGPYSVSVEAVDGGNVSLTVELIDRLGDGLERLRASAAGGLPRLLLSRRQWAWLAVCSVLLLGLLAPLVQYYLVSSKAPPAGRELALRHGVTPGFDRLWLTGPASAAHNRFIGNCTACHATPFSPVANASCQQCHGEVHQHADPAIHPAADLARQSCTSCHSEHKGSTGLIAAGSGTCVACHGGGKTAVTDFASAHPAFRATLPDGKGNMGITRVALHGESPAIEHSNLNFPHDRHLKANLRTPAGETVDLECGSCHRRGSGDAGFAPIRFSSDCQGCHQLSFDAALPRRQLPHAAPNAIRRFLEDTYVAAAVSGEYTGTDVPVQAVRRIPGGASAVEMPEKLMLRDWAAARAREALNSRLVRGQCGECHAVTDAQGGGFSVAPVQMMERFFPAARFDHGRHRGVACDSCHAAKQSFSARDVLLPDVETCRTCHGGESSSQKVASTCLSCHSFHHESAPLAARRP
ncbi:MAG: FHA domain-containing protein [Ferrovibrio sp.]